MITPKRPVHVKITMSADGVSSLTLNDIDLSYVISSVRFEHQGRETELALILIRANVEIEGDVPAPTLEVSE
jgi:hypothetical protein